MEERRIMTSAQTLEGCKNLRLPINYFNIYRLLESQVHNFEPCNCLVSLKLSWQNCIPVRKP